MKASKKEMLEVQHPRMTNVFDERNTIQSQELLELRSRDLENDSDWYVWRFYVDTVATQVGKLRTQNKDMDDKLDEQGAILCKGKLNDWVFKYRENKQALLHNVDLMLDLTNEEKQRQLTRSVTEWEEFFVKLEASWLYWLPDVKTMLKGPKDETNKTKHRQVTIGVSTNAAMRCTHTRKLKQSSFNPTKRNCSVEVTSENISLTQSNRVTDEERRVVGAANTCVVINSISDVKVLPEQSNNGSVKAKLEEESAKTKQVANQKKELPRNGIQLKLTQSQKVTKQSQPRKGPQDCYRTFKTISNSIKPPTGHELCEQSAHSRNDRHKVTDKESHLTNNKEPCFGRIDSKSIVGSHWRSNHKSVESSSMMRTVKQTQTRQTSSKQSSSDRNELPKRKDECMGKQEEMVLPKALDWTTRGKCTMKKWKPEQMKCSDMCPSYGKLQAKTVKRGAHEDSNMTNAECEINKGTSKRLTAEWMWNWPETFVVDDGWQDFRSETLLLDTTEVMEEEIHLVMNEQLIVQTEENLDYTMTETMKEHRSLAFASNNETSEELSVQFEMLQESAEVTTGLHKVQQGKLFQVTMFYSVTLLLEGNKCPGLSKSYGFVNQQQFALHENLNETAMYQKLCHGVVAHDKPLKSNAKGEAQTMNASFGKKNDFDFKLTLFEETIPVQSNVWNHWIGNGNSGMDAVSQANDIDETQLSNGHRKQLKKRSWKIEHNWNLTRGMEEGAQLNVNGTPQDDILWLREFRDNSSVTRMEMCSLKVPTTASWSNGSCNGPAALFKTMWTQFWVYW